jgi:signal transduction histidine kinase/FixJ family two-component response regulator/HPt (histidine-containing phosphotransfer) domain-containing protein
VISVAGLLFLLCGCATPDVREKPFYINLNEYPLYVKNGFDPAVISTPPDLSDGSWLVKMPGEQSSPRIVKNLGLDTPERFFLSPFEEEPREYTLLIPFTVAPEQFEKINGNKPLLPGIFLAALGDNWEIFLNGRVVQSEIHLDGDGRILSHRSRRYVSFPLDRTFFVPGTNTLAFRIVGEPNGADTGLWYRDPYYIGEYETIRNDHDEPLLMAFCVVYIFAGIYHLLHYINRTKDKYNLYYCLFSTLVGGYFFMRSQMIYSLISDSNISFRLEYAAAFMILPLLAAFLEHLSLGKIRKMTILIGAICLFLCAAQGIFPNLFRDDILYLWWGVQILEYGYVVVWDVALVFYRDIQARRNGAGKHPLLKAFRMSLIETPLGNILLGTALVALAGITDMILALLTKEGAFRFGSFGLVIFTITTTVILARRFGLLFSRIDEMNTLLEKSNLNLEATVQQRTRELERQTEAAKSSSRAKSVFLARMSHEIRTPLNAILGLSEVELQGELPGRTRIDLEKIYRSGSHLLEIVNDILDISKIEAGNFEITPAEYEFAGMINDAVQLNIVRIGSKPIEFKLELDETIPSKLYGDELRFKQILSNLLSNAFKYTEEGEVRLSIGWEKKGDAALICFTVEDTGRGIRQTDLEKLFSEYTQFNTTANRQIEGTGLGLSITKGLVEKMMGTITAESEYGTGSVFRVLLPQGILDEKPIGAGIVDRLRHFRFIEDRNRSRGNSLIRSWMPYGKVLVVDDLQTNLDVMTGLLMPYGLKVDTVVSGREAVERIRTENVRYDLIFMDHMMPEMDGIEAVRLIRHEIGGDYARTVPIVVLTANAIAGNREMFLESGFNDFIAKPIDIKQLDLVLNQWIRDIQNEETLKAAETQARERERSRKGTGQETEEAGGIDTGGRWLLGHPVEGIDFNAALTLYGHSGAALIPILKSFVVHTPSLVEKLDGYVESSLSGYAVEVHGLKGTCGAICATAAAALAGELERAAKEGEKDLVKSRHGEMRRQAQVLTEGLKVLLAEWDAGRPGAEKERREEPDRELLARLSAAAGGFNANVTEEILGELERCRYDGGEELILWLRERAENFDYDAMHKRLEEFLSANS